MNKYIFVVALLVSFASCKKAEIIKFQEKDAISMYSTIENRDSITYSFAYKLPDFKEDTVFINMRVQGIPVDYDRKVDLQILTGTTAIESRDFKLVETVIPAGTMQTVFPIVLYRTKELKEAGKKLVLGVKENENFIIPAYGGSVFEKKIIDINDFISKPSFWYLFEFHGFGEFSVVKFQFIMNVYNRTDFADPFPQSEFFNMHPRLKTALAEYEAINGPLYDENNKRLEF